MTSAMQASASARAPMGPALRLGHLGADAQSPMHCAACVVLCNGCDSIVDCSLFRAQVLSSLHKGNKHKTIAPTKMNAHSSRSHTVRHSVHCEHSELPTSHTVAHVTSLGLGCACMTDCVGLHAAPRADREGGHCSGTQPYVGPHAVEGNTHVRRPRGVGACIQELPLGLTGQPLRSDCPGLSSSAPRLSRSLPLLRLL
jgi:hypothetical protein